LYKIGKFQFASETEYFKYAMGRYFRKAPPTPINKYLSQKEFLDPAYREEIARTSDFPSVINTLLRDENEVVSSAALNNDFVVLIGRLQDVLGFGKKERREFSKQEVFRILLVLLMFEDDIEIINEVLQNASISIQMITIYIQLLGERGVGRKDEQILTEAQKSLHKKKMRIIKASEIKKGGKELSNEEQRGVLISHLSDDDKFIRKAVKNILIDSAPEMLRTMVDETISCEKEDVYNHNKFIALTEIGTLIKKREDLKHINPKDVDSISDRNKNKYSSMQVYFIDLVNSERRKLIENCMQDLTDFQNILLLTHGHCDGDVEVRNLANSVLTLEDLFSLVKDISTPQNDFKSILNVLLDHPDERVINMVGRTYEEESERLRNRLRELETMLRAYFDVIFQSIGFPEINQYLVAIKAFEEADKVINNFNQSFNKSLQKKLLANLSTNKEVISTFEQLIKEIEADVNQKILMELEHIQNMIDQIIELKNFDIEGLRPGAVETLDKELLDKAKRIWQNALGQYLGRIKNLSEMLKSKFEKLAKDNIRDWAELQHEFVEVFSEIDTMHKEKQFCTRTNECIECSSRGCSAERHLTEVRFILDELLDNFVEDIA